MKVSHNFHTLFRFHTHSPYMHYTNTNIETRLPLVIVFTNHLHCAWAAAIPLVEQANVPLDFHMSFTKYILCLAWSISFPLAFKCVTIIFPSRYICHIYISIPSRHAFAFIFNCLNLIFNCIPFFN